MVVWLQSRKRTSVPMATVPPPGRNPERTQEKILTAAFEEFAGKGFAGARVDAIALRAGINKRMLYHYFGDKEALFREVLRRKMAERRAWGEATPDDPKLSLPYWFELAIRDIDWIRLLEWEALQFVNKQLIDEAKRSKAIGAAVGRVRVRQESGHVTTEFTPKQILLVMTALAWFPVAFPQLSRMITGQRINSPAFQVDYKTFLGKFAAAFRPARSTSIHSGALAPKPREKTKLRSTK